MQFSAVQNEVLTALGYTSSTVPSALLTSIKFWINSTQQDVCGRSQWHFLLKERSIFTKAAYTTGTLTVTNASTAVTGSGTTWTTANGVIADATLQVTGDTEVYHIASVGSSTAITLAEAYQGTGGAGQTYTIRTRFYTLASDVGDIISVTEPYNPGKVYALRPRDLDLGDPNPTSTGVPLFYAVYGQDGSTPPLVRLEFWPLPNAVKEVRVRYKKVLTDLSADSDISEIPARWHHLMVDGAMIRCDQYRKEAAATVSVRTAHYETGVVRMLKAETMAADTIVRATRSDDGYAETFYGHLPYSTYPPQ